MQRLSRNRWFAVVLAVLLAAWPGYDMPNGDGIWDLAGAAHAKSGSGSSGSDDNDNDDDDDDDDRSGRRGGDDDDDDDDDDNGSRDDDDDDDFGQRSSSSGNSGPFEPVPEGTNFRVSYDNGWVEWIHEGRYTLIDPWGRLVSDRRASIQDLQRLRAAMTGG